ncbi:MAG: cobalamin-dependent protein [Actinobacteria bacterium]|nr:cobalamin-dependent protein [Actinomycetota bacterium]
MDPGEATTRGMQDAPRMQELVRAIADLDETTALRLVEKVLAAGESPLAVTQAAEEGMRLVGELYEGGTYYLSGLIMAGEIFRGILARLGPELEAEQSGTASGQVLVGTVQGDIHDIGKNILTTVLRGFGFTVRDLGVDVSPTRFLEEARSFRPDVVGLSGLTSASYKSMRSTVDAFRAAAGEFGDLPIVIGGVVVDETVARYTGARYWADDAMEGVRICEELTVR